MDSWRIFQGTGDPHDRISELPDPPSWRTFASDRNAAGEKPINFHVREEQIDAVNAALYLRRPLLVTGKPGSGKTSLAKAVAKELQLGEVLRWNITTRSTREEGLYRYDAIGRLQDARGEDNLAEIGRYIQLGALGTALLPSEHPRVLLIDEIDKSDIDLPNDLLNVFEEGSFEIPELARIADKLERVKVRTYDDKMVELVKGRVRCTAFPFVILTSNGERDFPPAFLRRCVRLRMQEPDPEDLKQIVKLHLGEKVLAGVDGLLQENGLLGEFIDRRSKGDLATDQLLNAMYLLTRDRKPDESEQAKLKDLLLKYLDSREDA